MESKLKSTDPANADGHPQGAPGTSPTAIVERFLDTLRTDGEEAARLLAPDAEWRTNGLPAIRGRERTLKIVKAIESSGTEFDVYIHAMSEDGHSVLTERTDVLRRGRMQVQFWVCGRFDVRDGQITLWQDYFDYTTTLAATARGLLGIALPALRAKPPPGDWSAGIRDRSSQPAR